MVAYLPIAIFLGVAIVFAALPLVLGRLIRPTPPPSEGKLAPYECGVEPVRDAHGRFSIRFYIVAMLFLIFDVETVFMFPWAIRYKQLALFGLIEMVIFLGILIVGYVYAWKRGALEWV
ncbi:MAG: NADH-quinone oxidoreductase subunit A [Acidobacteria bacterium]|nr:NADH-quinone oxidoreductase subunit A [Acidobacteriota bacterium]